ncbi:amino acid ABC transporter ATP-binding/permease protein [Blautia sp.]|uniref:amino acid ABC transporter ATP-binding/permease protein n=1 Tax=Blautia sp. TaxID=1955243 RepID=UPI00257B385C|nr:ABC transporter ATP-binding protein [Blautia sp.]
MIEKSMNTGYDISEKRVLPDRRRSALKIMGSLIGLVKPLIHIMILAVLLGTAGYLCAIFLTILAGQILIQGLGHAAGTQGAMSQGLFAGMTPQNLFVLMIVLAVARGILHYAEQYCNHFIAFKLLAIIRHKVFAALRRLCPAKLEGRDKGNLISIITTDIELLEVFYAHTISPAAIAALTSFMMVFFMGSYHVGAGIFALCAYLIVGIFIPLWNGSRGGNTGMEFRAKFGELNSYVLDSLRGLDETIQYGQGKNRERQMEEKSAELIKKQKKLSRMEGGQRSVTNLVILLASFGMLFFMLYLYGKQTVDLDGVVICTIAMMGSFGPVIALSNLSNNLNQTLASGERVLSVLEEKPQVEEIYEGEKDLHELGKEQENTFHKGSAQMLFAGAEASHVTFSYEEEEILRNYSVKIPAGKIVGIHGASGSGKSTLLKLLMRFWDADSGEVSVNGANVRRIPTRSLRDTESYVTQETHLFHDSIANNIAVGKPGASRQEIMEAAKKASVHDFIMSLPKGYDTEVGELGDTLSGGEKQRIGIARAFLHDAPFILMDEPTSNLDSLNEGIILKSLREEADKKTVVLVSHRKSTMNVADVMYEMENGRMS